MENKIFGFILLRLELTVSSAAVRVGDSSPQGHTQLKSDCILMYICLRKIVIIN